MRTTPLDALILSLLAVAMVIIIAVSVVWG